MTVTTTIRSEDVAPLSRRFAELGDPRREVGGQLESEAQHVGRVVGQWVALQIYAAQQTPVAAEATS